MLISFIILTCEWIDTKGVILPGSKIFVLLRLLIPHILFVMKECRLQSIYIS